MKILRITALTLGALVCFAQFAIGKTFDVVFDGSNIYRSFSQPELVSVGGAYEADFDDTFIFQLTTGGELSFTLSEKDDRGMFSPEYVDISEVEFTTGPAPSNVTPWVKEDPYYSGSDLVSTYTWDYLAPGTYNLQVTGSAFASGYPSTNYWMEDITFVANAAPPAVPLPGAALLLASGIAGLTITGRRKK
ncbi:MAG: hypothetical protein CSA33_05000 [Desulfobulbus propionicus]|nr:MAG: hypothetical protein CSA33_05000 [Desulfobulbus propionicus]